jgi:hypothetical protein
VEVEVRACVRDQQAWLAAAAVSLFDRLINLSGQMMVMERVIRRKAS